MSPPDQGQLASNPMIPSRRPREVRIALVLVIVSGLLWLPLAGSDPGMTQLATLLLLLYVVFAILVFGRRPRARLALAIVGGLLALLLAPLILVGFSGGSSFNPYALEYAIMDIIAVVAFGFAMVLLYWPNSNAYFQTAAANRPT